MAILDGSMRSATCKAIDEATVFRFPRDKFTELLDNENLAAYKLVFQMARVLALRQRALTAAVVELLTFCHWCVRLRFLKVYPERSRGI